MHVTPLKIAFDQIGPWEGMEQEIELLERFNQLPPELEHERPQLLKALLAKADEANVSAPFYLMKGHNVTLGRKVFLNQGVVIAAAAPVNIGHHTLIGPTVQIMTGTHPVDPAERQRWAYWAKPITIGENVWIGCSAIICPGVRIGNHSVIGAGSVVMHDIPDCVLAVGNPAQVVKQLTAPDETTLYELNP